MYLGWFDDNPKKSSAEKIGEAIAAYIERFRVRPNIVLVNQQDMTLLLNHPGMVIRAEGYIRRNNFWIGWEDGYASH